WPVCRLIPSDLVTLWNLLLLKDCQALYVDGRAQSLANSNCLDRVHPINKTENAVINATYCTLSGQNPDSRSRIIALHGALNKQPLKKWDTITGRWSTRCGESRCRHDTVQRGAVGAHL